MYFILLYQNESNGVLVYKLGQYSSNSVSNHLIELKLNGIDLLQNVGPISDLIEGLFVKKQLNLKNKTIFSVYTINHE